MLRIGTNALNTDALNTDASDWNEYFGSLRVGELKRAEWQFPKKSLPWCYVPSRDGERSRMISPNPKHPCSKPDSDVERVDPRSRSTHIEGVKHLLDEDLA
jgi:hypothetical protein